MGGVSIGRDLEGGKGSLLVTSVRTRNTVPNFNPLELSLSIVNVLVTSLHGPVFAAQQEVR